MKNGRNILILSLIFGLKTYSNNRKSEIIAVNKPIMDI